MTTKDDFRAQVLTLVLVVQLSAQPTIIFVGDITIGSGLYIKNFDNCYDTQGPGYFLSDMCSILGKSDLAIGNLETTISDSIGISPVKKKGAITFNFRGKPSYLDILKLGNIKMVSIANNHVYDFSDAGYANTIRNLDSARIAHYGFQDIIQRTIRGKTFTFIADVGFYYNDSLINRIKRYRPISDFIIVSIHWGVERTYHPITLQTKLGHDLIDAGANIVIGHHPHVLQPIEKYHDKYIVYSLGNFCFGGNSNPSDKLSALITVIFENPIKIMVIPVRISNRLDINDFHPIMASDTEAQKIFDLLQFKN